MIDRHAQMYAARFGQRREVLVSDGYIEESDCPVVVADSHARLDAALIRRSHTKRCEEQRVVDGSPNMVVKVPSQLSAAVP